MFSYSLDDHAANNNAEGTWFSGRPKKKHNTIAIQFCKTTVTCSQDGFGYYWAGITQMTSIQYCYVIIS